MDEQEQWRKFLGPRLDSDKKAYQEILRISELTREALKNSSVFDGLDASEDRTVGFIGVISGLLLEAALLWTLNDAMMNLAGKEREVDCSFADFAADIWRDFNR